ncbi:MAG: ribosomal RNA small subunit methyltransferase A [Deltaproteobacteria bacterium]|nr:ribosomal RNA small subunit methyltransferase A [Deltaproteobacteria bacterium]
MRDRGGSDRAPRAKKSFGQCFLVDGNIARIIAEAATTPPSGTTLEIGAGTGALTAPLLARAARVVAIERDRELIPVLRDKLAQALDEGRLVISEADAASSDWAGLVQDGPRPHVLSGNLPYQITGRILQRAVEHAPLFDRAVFMVQKEVAQRLVARPSTKEYGALTVFVRSAFQVAIRVMVPASCFRPRPKIDSAVVVLTPTTADPVTRSEPFARLVQAAFTMRRKTLRNAWSRIPDVESLAKRAGIDLDCRGEALSVEDFARAAACLVRSSS